MNLSNPAILCINRNESIEQLYYNCHKLSLFCQTVNWRKLIVKISFWLMVEIYLNLIAIDDFADMSEYVLMVFCHQQNQLIQVDIVEEKS